jgi:phosphatidylethanolamine-binding protein (PEBP) family uncharacterized protein
MESSHTELIGPFDHAPSVVAQLEHRALYVAVLTGRYHLDAPIEPLYSTYMNRTIGIGSVVHVRVRETVGCVCQVVDYDPEVMQMLSIHSVTEDDEVFTEFNYLAVLRAVTDLTLALRCDLDPKEKASTAHFRFSFSTHNETDAVITHTKAFPPRANLKNYRFVKPSEVLKPKRKHVDLEASLRPCAVSDGVDECTTELKQVLVETQAAAVDDDAEDEPSTMCDAERRHSRTSRMKNGSKCFLHVRFPDHTSCQSFEFPFVSTCRGGSNSTSSGVSPALFWENSPPTTKSFVVILEDAGKLNAPTRNGTTLWLVSDIPATHTSIEIGASQTDRMPPLSVEYPNTFGTLGYAAPCPVVEEGEPHLFRVHLLAMPHTRTLFHRAPDHSQLHVASILQQISRDSICVSTLEVPFSVVAEST